MNILMLAPLQKDNFEKIEQHFSQDHFIYATRHTVTQKMIDQCDVIVGKSTVAI